MLTIQALRKLAQAKELTQAIIDCEAAERQEILVYSFEVHYPTALLDELAELRELSKAIAAV